jgi:hypothetical protein
LQVSLLQWLQAKLFTRPGSNDLLHHYGRLFHEWLCDMYVNVESQTLKFIGLNQDRLRRASYAGLCDAVRQGELFS